MQYHSSDVSKHKLEMLLYKWLIQLVENILKMAKMGGDSIIFMQVCFIVKAGGFLWGRGQPPIGRLQVRI